MLNHLVWFQLLKEKCDKLTNENKQLKMELMRRNILENGGEEDAVFAEDSTKNNQFVGMFEYKQQSESLILKILVNGNAKFDCLNIFYIKL